MFFSNLLKLKKTPSSSQPLSASSLPKAPPEDVAAKPITKSRLTPSGKDFVIEAACDYFYTGGDPKKWIGEAAITKVSERFETNERVETIKDCINWVAVTLLKLNEDKPEILDIISKLIEHYNLDLNAQDVITSDVVQHRFKKFNYLY